MKGFSKSQKQEVSDAVDALASASDTLEKAIEAFNETVGPERDAVREALDAYNEKQGDLRSIYESIATDARDHYEERSDRWKEGEAGQAYSEWVDALESPDLDDVEIELPEDLEFPDSIPDWTNADHLPSDEPGGT